MRARLIPLVLLLTLGAAACGGTRVLASTRAVARHSTTTTTASARPGGRGGTQAVGAAVETSSVRVLFVGASVTDGWFASNKAHTYTALVAKGLAEGRPVQVRIQARPGVTAEDAADWNLTAPSDVVVVQIATNDFVRDVPLDRYSAAYAELLDRLRVASPKAELICLGAWLDPAEKNRLGLPAVDYDAAARTQCDAAHGRYVDLSAAYMDAANHGPAGRPTYQGPGDLFHPNDRGHAELASLILQADGIQVSREPAT